MCTETKTLCLPLQEQGVLSASPISPATQLSHHSSVLRNGLQYWGGFQNPFYGIRPLRGDPFEAIWARHHLGHRNIFLHQLTWSGIPEVKSEYHNKILIRGISEGLQRIIDLEFLDKGQQHSFARRHFGRVDRDGKLSEETLTSAYFDPYQGAPIISLYLIIFWFLNVYVNMITPDHSGLLH